MPILFYSLKRIYLKIMNDIYLEPEGKGSIPFLVKPKPDYAISDIIRNTDSIYFDFNPPIVTDIFTTEFVLDKTSLGHLQL
jgi:hypothetical protein